MDYELTYAEVQRLAEELPPWFSDEARNLLGRPPLASPTVDRNAQKIVFSDFDDEDEWMLDTSKAEWVAADALPEAAKVARLQRRHDDDWAEWRRIKADKASGANTPTEAANRLKDHIEVQSTALGKTRPGRGPGIWGRG